MAFNADTVERPFEKRGKFTATRGSNYGKWVLRLFQKERPSSFTPTLLENRLVEVKVRTVLKNERQAKHREHEKYPIVDQIVDFA